MRVSAVQPAVASPALESATFQRRSRTVQSKLAQGIDTSPRLVAQRERRAELIGTTLQPKLAASIDHSPRLAAQAQRKAALFAAPVQKKAPSHHLPHAPEEDETHQLKAKPDRTGLPSQLKAGVEALSGISLDGVKVHYNSSQPAQLHALAYAHGSDIHVAPGQEKHLPHEAWHVVQQAQGRVKPTRQMKGGVPVNDDAGLEREADMMGAKAVQLISKAIFENPHSDQRSPSSIGSRAMTFGSRANVIQAIGWESVGRLNPRRYLPEKLGGYTEEQMIENRLRISPAPMKDDHKPLGDDKIDKLIEYAKSGDKKDKEKFKDIIRRASPYNDEMISCEVTYQEVVDLVHAKKDSEARELLQACHRNRFPTSHMGHAVTDGVGTKYLQHPTQEDTATYSSGLSVKGHPRWDNHGKFDENRANDVSNGKNTREMEQLAIEASFNYGAQPPFAKNSLIKPAKTDREAVMAHNLRENSKRRHLSYDPNKSQAINAPWVPDRGKRGVSPERACLHLI